MKAPPEIPMRLVELLAVSTDSVMRIGEVADRVGLSHRSIRHYEEEGLLTPQYTPGGFRLYSEMDIQKLLIVMSMRPLDYSLEEIGRLLRAIDDALSEEEAPRRRGVVTLDEFAETTEERWLTLKRRVEIARSFRKYLNEMIQDAR